MFTYPIKRVTAALGVLAALLITLLAAGSPAKATTAACGNTPGCNGLLSAQAAPLEIATAVPAGQVHAGTRLAGVTPAFSPRGDWHVSANGHIRWMPNGTFRNLCITAVGDSVNDRPALEPCVSGTAGSSHQLWKRVNVIGGGFRVYQNQANGLVLALRSDASGTAVRLRPIGAGTGANKNFVLNKPF